MINILAFRVGVIAAMAVILLVLLGHFRLDSIVRFAYQWARFWHCVAKALDKGLVAYRVTRQVTPIEVEAEYAIPPSQQFTSRMDLSKITTSPIAKSHGWVK